MPLSQSFQPPETAHRNAVQASLWNHQWYLLPFCDEDEAIPNHRPQKPHLDVICHGRSSWNHELAAAFLWSLKENHRDAGAAYPLQGHVPNLVGKMPTSAVHGHKPPEKALCAAPTDMKCWNKIPPTEATGANCEGDLQLSTANIHRAPCWQPLIVHPFVDEKQNWAEALIPRWYGLSLNLITMTDR